MPANPVRAAARSMRCPGNGGGRPGSGGRPVVWFVESVKVTVLAGTMSPWAGLTIWGRAFDAVNVGTIWAYFGAAAAFASEGGGAASFFSAFFLGSFWAGMGRTLRG